MGKDAVWTPKSTVFFWFLLVSAWPQQITPALGNDAVAAFFLKDNFLCRFDNPGKCQRRAVSRNINASCSACVQRRNMFWNHPFEEGLQPHPQLGTRKNKATRKWNTNEGNHIWDKQYVYTYRRKRNRIRRRQGKGKQTRKIRNRKTNKENSETVKHTD